MEEHEKSRESTFSFLLCEESCGHDYVRDLEMLTNLTALRENLGAEVAGLVTKKTFDSINFGGGNMPFRMWRSLFILSLLVVAPPLSRTQDNAARIKAIQANLNNARQAYDQLPDHVKRVAHAQRRLAHLSDAVNRMASRLSKVTPGQPWSDDRVNEAPDENGLVRVTNPARDFRFTQFAGFIQDETAIARCGDTVVVGFNDTGSVLETLANGTRGISFSGVAASHDGGESFRDLGAVPPAGNGTNVFNADVLTGDPSVACSDPNTFYYAQHYLHLETFATLGIQQMVNLIALSTSHDGGQTWGDPVSVVTPATDEFGLPTDLFLFPQVAVDPSNHNRVYVAYTRIRFRDPLCGAVYTIEVEGSPDGGKTFGPPVIMDSSCFIDFNILDLGTRLAVSSQGRVYVAWESAFLLRIVGTSTRPQTILVASFMPGSAPTAPVVVGALSCTAFFNCTSPVTAGIDGFEPEFVGATTDMQGEFLNFRDFDLAVDRSGGPTDGSVYVAWSAALGNALAPEGADFSDDHFGFYAFTDIFISRSADGQNFSPPVQLNSDLQPLDGSRGHDHFQPTLAVDKTGKVAACWYDRRNDPENFQFERFCAESANAGSTWAEFRVNGTLSTPVTGQDLIAEMDEMGLYDGLTTDFLGHAPGFIGSFQETSSGMNPDIVAFGFR